MARKAITSPRKHASQERSRATVDALVEATARILVREGFDKASTNRIADVAGVSIGSLYQYFPCKEALVAAVMERHNRRLMEIVRAALAKAAGEPLASGARRLVTAAIDAHRFDPALHRVLAEQIPRTGRLKHVEAFNRENYSLMKSYFESRRAELRAVDIELAAFVAVTTVEALTHSAVLHHPEILRGEKADTLVDEITRLVLGYLR
jgi:AcrR family transcriptional regulator